MRKPITYLNLALLAAAIWLAAGVRNAWRQNHARYGLFARSATTPRAAPPATARLVAPPAAVAYTNLVNRSLFSPDRNNEQPVVKVERKPPPPLPFVVGTLNLGSGMVALMGDQKQASQGAFRRLKVGDEVGGYRVVAIAEHQVVLEFEGERTTIDVYESAQSVPGADRYAPPPPTPSTPSPVVSAVPAADSASRPQPAPGGTPAAASAQGVAAPSNEPLLTITIEGNRKKYARRTPFGIQTWYEDISPAPRPQ